jgi:Tfp pilus assembly protein PilF
MGTGMHEAATRQLHCTLRRHRPTSKQQAHVSQRLGQLAYQAGHYQQAAEHLRTAIALNPDSGELYNWLGLCELGEQQPTEAATSFQKSCELGYSLAHTNLGICHARLGQLKDAVLCFEEAVALLPNNPVARANYEAGVAACSAND